MSRWFVSSISALMPFLLRCRGAAFKGRYIRSSAVSLIAATKGRTQDPPCRLTLPEGSSSDFGLVVRVTQPYPGGHDQLGAQDYPRDQFEVLVVDDGSVRSMNGLMDSLRHRLNVTLLKKAHSGSAAARNYGAGHALGLYLAFTDDDCMPAPDWLGRFASLLDVS
jgi:hypothetical protein